MQPLIEKEIVDKKSTSKWDVKLLSKQMKLKNVGLS